MKIILKRIFLSIIITFSIVSIINLSYNYYIINQNITTNTSNSNKTHQETIYLQDDMSLQSLIKNTYYNGMSNVTNQFIDILIISIIVGIILGLIFSVKEFSKIKYILFYIVGNILINTFMGIIIKNIYFKSGVQLSFFEAFAQSFKNTIIIYSIAFITVVLINIFDNKMQINKLNKLYKKNSY